MRASARFDVRDIIVHVERIARKPYKAEQAFFAARFAAVKGTDAPKG